jgi:hypothetical protein
MHEAGRQLLHTPAQPQQSAQRARHPDQNLVLGEMSAEILPLHVRSKAQVRMASQQLGCIRRVGRRTQTLLYPHRHGGKTKLFPTGVM